MKILRGKPDGQDVINLYYSLIGRQYTDRRKLPRFSWCMEGIQFCLWKLPTSQAVPTILTLVSQISTKSIKKLWSLKKKKKEVLQVQVMEKMVKIQEKAHEVSHNNIKLAQMTQKSSMTRDKDLPLQEGQEVLVSYVCIERTGKVLRQFCLSRGCTLLQRCIPIRFANWGMKKVKFSRLSNIANRKLFFAAPKEDNGWGPLAKPTTLEMMDGYGDCYFR